MQSFPRQQPEIEFAIKSKIYKASYYTFCSYCGKFRDDPNIKQYQVKSEVSEDSFKNFLEACKGKFYNINASNYEDLLKLCEEFQGDQIRQDIIDFIKEKKDINLLSYYSTISKHNSDQNYDDTVESVANSIAEKLDEHISDPELINLDEEALLKVLFNDNIKTNKVSENQIFDVAWKKAPDTKSQLFSHINFSNLSEGNLDKLFKRSLDQMPDSIDTKCIWDFLTKNHEANKQNSEEIKDLKNKLEIMQAENNEKLDKVKIDFENYLKWKKDRDDEYKDLKVNNNNLRESYFNLFNSYQDVLNDKIGTSEKCMQLNDSQNKMFAKLFPFKGIVYKLKKENGDNISEYIKIKVPNEGKSTSEYDPYDLFNYEDGRERCYYHNLKQDHPINENWIQFDFLDNPYIFYAISIETNYFGSCFNHPKDFEILGSNDENDWEQIFITEDDKYLNGMGKHHTYFFENKDKSYRFIRFKQNDSHSQYKDRYGIIALAAIEFFGKDVNQDE